MALGPGLTRGEGRDRRESRLLLFSVILLDRFLVQIPARDNAQCSTGRALFSQGNSLEKGREKRQQHLRPIGSSRKPHRDIFGFLDIRVRWPRRSEPTVGLVRLSSREILLRVVIIQALARLTLSRPRSSESVTLQAPAWLILSRAKSSESVTLGPSPTHLQPAQVL